ncbi:MAG: hypothetical protein IJ683_05875 [Butyrivibrio sp.]|nr:hypothetical protein [Butyrivibrio sp.]MBR1641835.1 hypothetical protein [Butyrivibrio sp.]
MYRISDLTNLGLSNIAPNPNDTDLQVLTVAVINTRDENGKPTTTVDYVSLTCLGHGTGQPSIKILQPSIDIVNRVMHVGYQDDLCTKSEKHMEQYF